MHFSFAIRLIGMEMQFISTPVNSRHQGYLVSKCVKLSPFSKTIFILDLALNYIDKL